MSCVFHPLRFVFRSHPPRNQLSSNRVGVLNFTTDTFQVRAPCLVTSSHPTLAKRTRYVADVWAFTSLNFLALNPSIKLKKKKNAMLYSELYWIHKTYGEFDTP